MKLKEYKSVIDKNIKQIDKNISEIQSKVVKLRELQSTFIKIDKI